MSSTIQHCDIIETPRRADVHSCFENRFNLPVIQLHDDAKIGHNHNHSTPATRPSLSRKIIKKKTTLKTPSPINKAPAKTGVTPNTTKHYRRASDAVTPEVPAFTPPPRPDVKFFDRNKRLAPIRAERMLPSPLPKPLSRSKRLAPIRRKKQVAKKRVRFEQLI